MSPLVATVLVLLISGFQSHPVSSTPTPQGNGIDVTHQAQPLDAETFPTVGKRQSRTPDTATVEDSYIAALRHSQDSRRKSSALPIHHAHHVVHEGSLHAIPQGIHNQFNNDFPLAYPTYVSTSRPLTAMEMNYLKPKKQSPVDVAADIADVESLDDEEELSDEEQLENEDESEARQFVRLTRRPYYSVTSANSIYSIYLANDEKLANRKHDDITATQNSRILTKSKPMSVSRSDDMQFTAHRAAGAFKKGTMGSTAGLSSTLNSVNNRANRWLPAAAAVSRRKKRSVLLNSDEEKNNKHHVEKRQSANDANKMSAINKPILLHYQKLSPTSKRTITSARSSDNKSTSSKLKNLKATQFKQILPWFHSKFSKNQKRTSNQEATEIEQTEKLPNSGDDNVATLTNKIPPNGTQGSLHDTLSKKEGHAHVDHSKFTHGHGIIVSSDHVSTSSTVIKDAVIHDTSNDLSTYTHGHGIVIPNAPVHNKPLGESSLVSDVVDNQNILSLLANGTTSSSNVVEGHDDVQTTENISPLDPLIASLDGPVLTTGVFSDEIDLALDDLESLMTDIIIAPLQVQAVVAEDGTSSDAVIIEAAQGNQPDSVPVVSNLANIFIAPSVSSVSSSSSSSSDGSISSGGIVGGDSSAVLADPFALLNTIGLAAIGIFVLTLPIWIPLVVARMKKRRNSFSRRSPFVFPIGSFNNDEEFHPYSTLLQKLTPSDAAFNNAGPLNSEEVYGPASPSYFGRKAARRRRSNRRNTFRLQ